MKTPTQAAQSTSYQLSTPKEETGLDWLYTLFFSMEQEAALHIACRFYLEANEAQGVVDHIKNIRSLCAGDGPFVI